MKLFSRFSKTPQHFHASMLVCVLPCLFGFATANAQSHPESLDRMDEVPEARELTHDAAQLADLIRPAHSCGHGPYRPPWTYDSYY